MSDQPGELAFTDSRDLHAACSGSDTLLKAAAYRVLWAYLYRVALQIVYDQPAADALAQDSAQTALIRIHERLAECREPAAFRSWARRIVSNLTIDALRRTKREIPLDDSTREWLSFSDGSEVETQAARGELFALVARAPISKRSLRVVLGRYRDGHMDEHLAQEESRRAGRSVLPSHIQVTRSKDIARLRHWKPVQSFRD